MSHGSGNGADALVLFSGANEPRAHLGGKVADRGRALWRNAVIFTGIFVCKKPFPDGNGFGLYILCFAKLVISALFRHEFVVSTRFNYSAVLDEHYLVAMLDSGKTVRDDERGSALEQRLNTYLKKLFRVRVD